MPPFIKVPTLYVLSVNNVINILHDYVVETRENADRIRRVVLSSLHAGIKQHLVEIATKNYRGSNYVLFDLLEVLLDHSTTKLHVVDEENSLWLNECAELYSRLERCQAIGLEELSIRVRLNPRNDLEAVSSMNSSFYRTLRHMRHLKVLVLRSVCDNEILRLLGRNCPHLEYLDVTSSWLVDDKGIRQLLLKDPESFNNDVGGEYSWLEMEVNEQRSACCLGLREVRIQDTNTSLTGVLYLLIFASQLRSLGGFIYYRNVGDAVVKLASKIPSLNLSLAELWDTCLPRDKAEIIGKAAPNLTVLYTRADHLSNVSSAAFPPLTSLTVDFDFHDQAYLLEAYLQLRGHHLRKLALVDQKHAVSLSMLDKYCPALTELSAKVFGGGRWCSRNSRGGEKSLLPSLQTAHLRLGSNITLRAILGGCHGLCHLDLTPEDGDEGNRVGVFCVVGEDWPLDAQDHDFDGEEVPVNEADEEPDDDDEDFEDVGLDDAGIVDGLALNPNSKLVSLVVRREWSCGNVGLRSLIYSCPKLRSVGDLYYWKGLSDGEKDVANHAMIIAKCNWDLSLIYRGYTYPKRKGFPLWEPPSIDSDVSDEEED